MVAGRVRRGNDVVYSWLFIVAGGWAVSVVMPQWESVGPWVSAAVFIFLFGITMAWRFEKGRWRSINLLGGEEPRAEDTGDAAVAAMEVASAVDTGDGARTDD